MVRWTAFSWCVGSISSWTPTRSGRCDSGNSVRERSRAIRWSWKRLCTFRSVCRNIREGANLQKANAENAEEHRTELLGCGGTRFLRCHFIAFFGQLHQGEKRVIDGSGNAEFRAAACDVAVKSIDLGAFAAH